MRKTFLSALAALLFCAGITQAQTTNSAPSVAGGLGEIWTALTTSSTNVDLASQTNWAVIPYISYDLKDKKYGGGGAVLYAVTPNFWAGARMESINGHQTTAGVQAQLQVTKKVFGLSMTPFVETSVGIGSSSLYGSAGAGGFIAFHTWDWGNKYSLTFGVVGDYEHVVYGTENWNQINGGPLLRFSF
jgi:hypothetical protein